MYCLKSLDKLAPEKMPAESREWKHLPQEFLCALCTCSHPPLPLSLHATTELFLILWNSMHLVEFYTYNVWPLLSFLLNITTLRFIHVDACNNSSLVFIFFFLKLIDFGTVSGFQKNQTMMESSHILLSFLPCIFPCY